MEKMEDSGPAAIIFIILVFINILFYGFGSAIQFLNRNEVEKKAVEESDKKSVRICKIMDSPTCFINTLQLVSTMIHIVMGGFFLGLWATNIRFFLYAILKNNPVLKVEGVDILKIVSLLISAAIIIYLLLSLAVILPKKIASKYPEQWAYLFVNPVSYITNLLLPITSFVTLTSNVLLKIFGIWTESDTTDVTEAEIISMVNEGHEQGVLLASEAEMIANIFEFGDKEARDIMTHRINIQAIDSNMSFKDAIHFMLQEQNSRYPVYEENIDHILGIINLKDALRIQALNEQINCPVKEVKGLMREAQFIPETRNIDILFKTMQSLKIQMVIVVDEYGQTAGLVAMEDILEEIVGNIMDEYDEDEAYIEDKGNNEYIMEGMTPLEELEERFEISFEEEEFDTLNGFLISKMDRIPNENEEFNIDVGNYNFKVLSVENKMIHTVLVTKIQKPVRKEIE